MTGDNAIKTYRYLRIGMIGVVGLLTTSVLLEYSKVNCLQDSVSAYYYTPVKAIFVGGLMAIGLCLIVIKGRTPWEDSFLNFAGMLAPVVAVVPTTTVGKCWSVEPKPLPLNDQGGLADWVVANIDNNVTALLLTGFVGLLLSALIAMYATRDLLAVAHVGGAGTRLGLLGAALFLLVGAIAFWGWNGFDTHAHSIAAIAMFAFLAAAVASNAVDSRKRPDERSYVWLYAGIALLMAAAALLLPVVAMMLRRWGSGWNHIVFFLEATEIALFVAFWVVQTKQHWGETSECPGGNQHQILTPDHADS